MFVHVCYLQYVFRRAVSVRGIRARTTSALLHPSRKPLQPGVTPPQHHHTADVSRIMYIVCVGYKILIFRCYILNWNNYLQGKCWTLQFETCVLFSLLQLWRLEAPQIHPAFTVTTAGLSTLTRSPATPCPPTPPALAVRSLRGDTGEEITRAPVSQNTAFLLSSHKPLALMKFSR